jgi:hypothetical protein
MKHKTLILTIILIVLLLLQSVNATTTYNINDVRNNEATIHIGTIKTNEHIYSEIDGRNINEAPTGGYAEDTGEYFLPYDLGLGHHTLEIIIIDEWGETVKTLTYNFCIIKHSENPNVYDEYSPYYYCDEVTDEDIEQDYQDINKPLTDIDEENIVFEETNTIFEETILQNLPSIEDYRVNVNIKKLLNGYDEGLTSVEI